MPLEMNSCGKCSKCLAGGRVHGPYEYHYVWDSKTKTQHRRYGPAPGSSPGPSLGSTPDDGLSYRDYAGAHDRGKESPAEEEARKRREKLSKREDRAARRRHPLHGAAQRDAAERERNLTPKQRKQLQEVLDGQARLKKLQREKKDAGEARERTQKPGLTARMAAAAEKEIGAQFANEISELQKRIKESRAEMHKTLKAG